MTDSKTDLVERVTEVMQKFDPLAGRLIARAVIAAVLDDLMEPTAKQVESARYSFWVGVPDDVSATDAAKIALQEYVAAKRRELGL